MFATAKNYDIVCFQLRNYIPQLDNPLKKELDKLLANIQLVITSNKKVKPQLDSLLPQIFNFRFKAIKWFIENGDFDLQEMFKSTIPKIEELKDNPHLEILVENILFALRCNLKVVNALIVNDQLSEETFTKGQTAVTDITYDQFIASIAVGIPNAEAAQKIIDFTNSSLFIEFVVVAAALINENKLKVTEKTINELAFIVADAGQEYAAIATEIGLLNTSFLRNSFTQVTFDNDFITEQKELADLGLDDFNNNL